MNLFYNIALKHADMQLHEAPMMIRIFSQQNCFAELAIHIWPAKAEQVARGINIIITDV